MRDRGARRARKRWSWLLAALVLPLPSSLAPLPPSAHAAEPPAATKDDAAALAAAKQLLGDQQYRAAAKAYEAANEHAGGHCGECLLGLAGARLGLGDLDAATVAIQEAVGALAGDPLQGIAYLHLGEIFLRRAGACRPPPCGPAAVAELTAAGEAFEKAIATGRRRDGASTCRWSTWSGSPWSWPSTPCAAGSQTSSAAATPPGSVTSRPVTAVGYGPDGMSRSRLTLTQLAPLNGRPV